MSTEATIDSAEEDLSNAYQTMTWMGNEISFWTDKHAFIRLRYDDNETITFLKSNRSTMEYDTLIKDMSSNNQHIYIEWVQSTGKYLYFDL